MPPSFNKNPLPWLTQTQTAPVLCLFWELFSFQLLGCFCPASWSLTPYRYSSLFNLVLKGALGRLWGSFSRQLHALQYADPHIPDTSLFQNSKFCLLLCLLKVPLPSLQPGKCFQTESPMYIFHVVYSPSLKNHRPALSLV